MITTYGARVMQKPEGMLRAFKINNLVRLDEETGDGRLLRSAGAGTRNLPRSVFGGFSEGDGHGDNVVIGRLDAVEFDPDNNTATAWGWLLDDENGRQAARYIGTGAMRHNSIHMAEIELTIQWKSDDPNSPDFMDYTLVFEKWNVASTTMLGIPAFKDSEFELDGELVAALYSDEAPLEIEGSFEVTTDLTMPSLERELTASAEPRPPTAYFLRAEATDPTPITVGEMDGDGWIPVFGNLARWNVCHDGFADRCVIAPYSPDQYAGFNARSVLSSAGPVGTGPIFFQGGHPDRPIGNGDPAKAYGGIENAWADVRVTPGVHGPWIAGVVRPGVTSSAVYAARASSISGHWAPDGRLLAIVSVNVPGNEVPRTNKVWTDEDGNVTELVASFVPDCAPERPAPDVWAPFITDEALRDMAMRIAMLDLDAETVTPEEASERLSRAAEGASDVDVTDADAVARHIALLDLEAEEDRDLGLV